MAIQSTLPAYVQDNSDKLIKRAVLSGRTAADFTLQTGVKTKARINLLSTDVTLQDGTACGFNAAGDVNLSSREITAPVIKVNMSFCDKTLLNTALQHDVRVAAGTKVLPFEQEFTDSVIESLNKKIEKITWQGDTASVDVDLKRANGLLKILNAEASVIKPTKGANVVANIDAVFMAIPADILDRAVIYVSEQDYRAYMVALMAKNNYHIPADGADKFVTYYPGTNVKIKAVAGLNGANHMVALDPAMAFRGTDLSGDEEKFDMWYSQDNQEFRLAIQFTMGWQVAFPDQVVVLKTIA